jgi:hypothetical protein
MEALEGEEGLGGVCGRDRVVRGCVGIREADAGRLLDKEHVCQQVPRPRVQRHVHVGVDDERSQLSEHCRGESRSVDLWAGSGPASLQQARERAAQRSRDRQSATHCRQVRSSRGHRSAIRSTACSPAQSQPRGTSRRAPSCRHAQAGSPRSDSSTVVQLRSERDPQSMERGSRGGHMLH